MPRPLRARDLQQRLRAVAQPARASSLQRFFKTAPGEYGAGDRFLGVTMPQIRRVAAGSVAAPLDELERLLDSPWHEDRMLALLVLAHQYRHANDSGRTAIYRLYLRRTDRINNWDLVDVTAPAVVGAHLLARPRTILRHLARSTNLWERRIAIIATYAFIRAGDYEDTLRLGEMLLRDPHDLLHKAVGWMLREVGKRDEQALRRFLDRHAATMPRTMLRYAIERLPPARRRAYMQRKPKPLPVR